jgi:hypothetical protein
MTTSERYQDLTQRQPAEVPEGMERLTVTMLVPRELAKAIRSGEFNGISVGGAILDKISENATVNPTPEAGAWEEVVSWGCPFCRTVYHVKVGVNPLERFPVCPGCGTDMKKESEG